MAGERDIRADAAHVAANGHKALGHSGGKLGSHGSKWMRRLTDSVDVMKERLSQGRSGETCSICAGEASLHE